MPITILSPDGSQFVFPDNTPQETISAAMRKHFGEPTPKPPDKPTPGVLETAADMATSLGRGFNRGVSALPELAYRGTRALVGAGGYGYQMMPWEETYAGRGQAHLTRGAPTTTPGRYAEAVGEAGGAAAIPAAGIYSAAPRMAASAPTTTLGHIGRDMGRTITAAPGPAVASDAASVVGAGLAQQGAEDAGAGPTGQAFASMAGGFAAPALRFSGAPTTPRSVRHAEDKFREAVRRDMSAVEPDVAPARFASRAEALMEASPSARVADAGGENVRTLMRLASDRPNAMRDTAHRVFDERARNQWQRIETELVHRTGVGEGALADPRRFFDVADNMAAELDTIGRTRIQPHLRHETPLTPRLAEVLRRPTSQELIRRVQRRFADEGQMIPPTSTEFLFRMKLELDEQIGTAMRARQMGNSPPAGWDSATLTRLKRDLLNNIDNQPFKDGLREYATHAPLRRVMDEGYENFNTMRAEQIRLRVNELHQDGGSRQALFFRMGAIRAIVDKIRTGNANNDRVKSVFSSPEMQMKLRALMPRGALRRFQQTLIAEARLSKTREAIKGNSITNRLQMERQAAAEPMENAITVGRAAGDLLSGRFAGLAELGARTAGKARARLISPDTAAEILRMGLSRDPEVLARLAPAPSRSLASEPADARRILINALMGGYTGAGAR